MRHAAVCLILIFCSLTTNQVTAWTLTPEQVGLRSLDYQLLHEADSDELRAVTEEAAHDSREQLHEVTHRKPIRYQF
ncbi:hypothetical protein A9B99_00905 [Mangrovibacter phragmitis]|jgi:hypothetical protein|uniref:DUF2554 domain-containing protein n=1 Tax=Mangrovibacter phragmitis TaxID=1691903 RepID=A0A1B7L7K2_9ENTR|nr:DUF2554 family protein [Mangrovibacter phragmitis]OAT78327.1 hypothetical protein A9B99_00905 [Mangrovibacter phragmitis]